jgi:hypothetical protein
MGGVPTELMIEYVKGIMIVSAAFITATGIIFAVSINKNSLNKFEFGLLLLSILLGAASITTAMKWFNDPNDSTKSAATWILLFQFFSWYYPACILFSKLWQRDNDKNDKCEKVVEDNQEQAVNNDEVKKKVTLKEIKQMITNSKKEIIKTVKNNTLRQSLGIGLCASGVSLLGVGGIAFFTGFRLPGGLGDFSTEYIIVSLAELIIGFVMVIMGWRFTKK